MVERHLATVWESIAEATPASTALVQGDLRRSWQDFEARAARLAGALVAGGLGPGSKVAQYLYNAPEYLETYFAALKVRAVPVNVNYRYLEDELRYLLVNSDAEALVFHASLADRVAAVAREVPGLRLLLEVDDAEGAGRDRSAGGRVDRARRYEDVIAEYEPAPPIERDPTDVTMVYTGGTTGMPKGVMGAVGQAVDTFMATTPPIVGLAPVERPEQIAEVATRLAEEGRSMSALPACPLMHGTGLLIGALPALTFGGVIVLLRGRGLDVEELWDTVERQRVQAITVVGDAFARPMLRGLGDGPARDLSCVQLIMSSGAMFSAEVKQGLLDHLPGAVIVDFIAATEGAMGTSISMAGAPATTGRFRPNPGVKVFAADGTEVAAGSGDTGMVAVPSPTTGGYYKDPDKTAATFQVIDGVRYSLPGDWATVEQDGTIVLLGRGSQCINTGGEKVYPEEVEEAVKRHQAVEDCLIFGVADERFGQRVVGLASLAPGAPPVDAAVVVDAVRGQLSAYKLPRRLLLVDVVPRAPNGKADYRRAREVFEHSTRPEP